MTHNTATIEELGTAKRTISGKWTFSYKKRRWSVGAYIPYLEAYEIWTWKGDRMTILPGDTIVGKVEFTLYKD